MSNLIFYHTCFDRESPISSGKLKEDQSNEYCAVAMGVTNQVIFFGSDLMDSEKVISKQWNRHAF